MKDRTRHFYPQKMLLVYSVHTQGLIIYTA